MLAAAITTIANLTIPKYYKIPIPSIAKKAASSAIATAALTTTTLATSFATSSSIKKPTTLKLRCKRHKPSAKAIKSKEVSFISKHDFGKCDFNKLVKDKELSKKAAIAINKGYYNASSLSRHAKATKSYLYLIIANTSDFLVSNKLLSNLKASVIANKESSSNSNFDLTLLKKHRSKAKAAFTLTKKGKGKGKGRGKTTYKAAFT